MEQEKVGVDLFDQYIMSKNPEYYNGKRIIDLLQDAFNEGFLRGKCVSEIKKS